MKLSGNRLVRPAQDVIFKSTDRIHWERVCDVKLEGNSLYFESDLASEETFFTVTLYYTMENYKNLVDTVRGNEYIKTEIIGTDDGGDDIYAFTASDFSVPESEKICVYLQGVQHCSEFNGAHICDFMLRFFADGNAEAKALLKKYVFQFVPVVSVTSWRLGLDVHSSGINPNRDWIEKKLPSTKAVHRYLDSLENKPLLLIDIHSGLANYGCWETCQALSINDDLSEEEKSEMRRVYRYCLQKIATFCLRGDIGRGLLTTVCSTVMDLPSVKRIQWRSLITLFMTAKKNGISP